MSDPIEYFLMKRAATLIANQQLHTNDVQNRKTAESITKLIISEIHNGIIGESASVKNVRSILGMYQIVFRRRFISLHLSILHPSCRRVFEGGGRFRDDCIYCPNLAVSFFHQLSSNSHLHRLREVVLQFHYRL